MAFQPTDISSCVFWVRADLGVTTSGANVTAWADQSGSGHSLVNVSTTKPQYDATGINSLPTIDFNRSTGTYLRSNSFTTLSQPNTLFIVHDLDEDYNTGSLPFDGIDSTNRNTLAYYGSGFTVPNGIETNAGGSGGAIAVGSQIRSPGMASATFNGSSSIIRFNGKVITSSEPAGTAGIAGFSVGARFAAESTYGFTGKIAEVIFYNKLCSSTEIAQVESYLVQRYALPVPYASGTVSGQGTLTGTAYAGLSATGTVSGQGTLTGSTVLILYTDGTVAGQGTITANAYNLLYTSAAVSGQGSLTGNYTLVLYIAGDITSNGTVTAVPVVLAYTDGTILGQGVLTASAFAALSASGTIPGQGDLSGTASLIYPSGFPLYVTGTINGIGVTGVITLDYSAHGRFGAMNIPVQVPQ